MWRINCCHSEPDEYIPVPNIGKLLNQLVEIGEQFNEKAGKGGPTNGGANVLYVRVLHFTDKEPTINAVVIGKKRGVLDAHFRRKGEEHFGNEWFKGAQLVKRQKGPPPNRSGDQRPPANNPTHDKEFGPGLTNASASTLSNEKGEPNQH
ncbi:MAG: hypothetical protein Q9159_006605 [Coniocarpon cinnabarinum]